MERRTGEKKKKTASELLGEGLGKKQTFLAAFGGDRETEKYAKKVCLRSIQDPLGG